MDLVPFLRGWYEGRISASADGLDVTFGSSDPSYPKRSAWVEIEGLHRVGRFVLWDTGETELEVFAITNAEPVLLRSQVVSSEDDIAALLTQLVSEVRVPP